MLSIGRMGRGQGNYYTGLAQEDYYQSGGEPPGQWLGRGAEALGLSGQVEKEALHHLFVGMSPDGTEPLTQNAGEEAHRPGWDLTFSAPKSVSVLWSQADEQTRHVIQDAHFEAVKRAVSYLEETAAVTRRGKLGAELEPAHLIAAAFEHGTSRAQDPQLHTHTLFLNVAVRLDGTTGTLASPALYQHKMAAGALYRAELAHQLEQRIGVEVERRRNLFEVRGVPQPLIDTFSTRRHEVEEALRERGLNSAKAAAVAARDTRLVKQHIARETLFQEWRVAGAEHGFAEDQARRLIERAPRRSGRGGPDPDGLARQAVADITEQASYFSEKDLVRRTAEAAPGRGVSADDVRRAVRTALATDREIVPLGRWKGEERFTTREMLALEEKLIGRVERLKGRPAAPVAERTVDGVIGIQRTMGPEQAEALRYITAETGGVAFVSGMAGTGKTTLLRGARQAWTLEGYEVLGVALSGKAAQGLQEGAGIESRTIARFLRDIEPSRMAAPDSCADPSRRDSVRRPTVTITPKTVVVVDEAGMVGTRQMDAMVSAVERGGGKIVFVGDERQLQPIEAGGPFRVLSDRVGRRELTDIRRQNEAWARESVQQFARGDARAAMRSYADRGLLHVADDRERAATALIADWREKGVRNPEDSLIFTGTRAEAATLNRLAQDARRQAGALGDAMLRVHGERIFQGDRVLFTKNSTLYGVKNGTLGTVERLDSHGLALSIRLDGGQRTVVPIEQYDHVKLGYAVTTHKGQGVTVENAFVLVGGAMQDRELTYVQASRARSETRLYTGRVEAGDQLADLVRSMSQSHQKDLAVNVMPDDPRSASFPRTQNPRPPSARTQTAGQEPAPEPGTPTGAPSVQSKAPNVPPQRPAGPTMRP